MTCVCVLYWLRMVFLFLSFTLLCSFHSHTIVTFGAPGVVPPLPYLADFFLDNITIPDSCVCGIHTPPLPVCKKIYPTGVGYTWSVGANATWNRSDTK